MSKDTITVAIHEEEFWRILGELQAGETVDGFALANVPNGAPTLALVTGRHPPFVLDRPDQQRQ